MKLRKLLGGQPAAGGASDPRPRRRRRPRPDAPRTLVPVDDARPSWLPADAPVGHPSSALAAGLDAARERLRREIPPVDDEA